MVKQNRKFDLKRHFYFIAAAGRADCQRMEGGVEDGVEEKEGWKGGLAKHCPCATSCFSGERERGRELEKGSGVVSKTKKREGSMDAVRRQSLCPPPPLSPPNSLCFLF